VVGHLEELDLFFQRGVPLRRENKSEQVFYEVFPRTANKVFGFAIVKGDQICLINKCAYDSYFVISMGDCFGSIEDLDPVYPLQERATKHRTIRCLEFLQINPV
jgi:hypothetical protein